MSLSAGSRLGPYEITAQIGAERMGLAEISYVLKRDFLPAKLKVSNDVSVLASLNSRSIAKSCRTYFRIRSPIAKDWWPSSLSTRSTVTPHRVRITLPLDLAPQPANLGLPAQAQQGAQALFYHFALGLQAGGAKSVPHQLIVNHDVGPHRSVPSCKTACGKNRGQT